MPRRKSPPSDPRASWKGRLVVDLVQIPVAAINAAAPRENEIHFHQLHSACHSRVRLEKVCPIHGPLAAEEVVLGYEFEPDRYVEIHGDELARMKSHGEPLLTLDRFVRPSDIDPIFYDGRAYFLVPDPEESEAVPPYNVLHAAMRSTGLYGVGEVVFSGREQLVVVRSLDGLLVMQMLNYRYQLRKPEPLSESIGGEPASTEQRTIAEELVRALVDENFDLERYEDLYEQKLRALVEAKVAGDEIVASPDAEVQPPVINLTDALRRSIDRARVGRMRLYPPGRSAAR